jgi:hypothetical protein
MMGTPTADFLACLALLDVAPGQVESAIETLIRNGFNEAAAQARLRDLAFYLWTPKCQPH